MLTKILFIFVAFYLAPNGLNNQRQEKGLVTYKIEGRVVNERGDPVIDAEVSLLSQLKGELADVHLTGKDGRFKIVVEAGNDYKSDAIIVSQLPPKDAFCLVPNLVVLKLEGKKFFTKNNAPINLGDLEVHVRYGKAEIFLPNLQLNRRGKKDWIYYQIRDKKNNVLLGGGIPYSEIHQKNNSNMTYFLSSLPVGEWTIELFVKDVIAARNRLTAKVTVLPDQTIIGFAN